MIFMTMGKKNGNDLPTHIFHGLLNSISPRARVNDQNILGPLILENIAIGFKLPNKKIFQDKLFLRLNRKAAKNHQKKAKSKPKRSIFQWFFLRGICFCIDKIYPIVCRSVKVNKNNQWYT